MGISNLVKETENYVKLNKSTKNEVLDISEEFTSRENIKNLIAIADVYAVYDYNDEEWYNSTKFLVRPNALTPAMKFATALVKMTPLDCVHRESDGLIELNY